METELYLYLAVVSVIAAFVHGSIGFGFPMLATPLFALVSDVQTAIMLTLIPNLLVNTVSILSEGHFFQAVRQHYVLVILTALGSAVGTAILISLDSELFKLLLAIAIFGYLLSDWLHFSFAWIRQFRRMAKVVFGVFAGFIGGLTNVMAPILIIYSVESRQSKKATIQSANLCFLFGKLTQLCLFIVSGSFGLATVTTSAGLLLMVAIGLPVGIYLKSAISDQLYKRILQCLLAVIALTLIVQVVR